jgi:peptidoglycan/xylan/chitin deacetylase (PgdA/CDA1 family)
MSRLTFWKALAGYLIIWPSVLRNCENFGPVQTTFSTTKKEVWLTIDDGPDPRQTPYILDVLASEGVSATFFVIGTQTLSQAPLSRRIFEEGHDIQNHSHTHPSATFWAVGYRRARKELMCCSESITEITGSAPTRFRAPVGMANPFVHLAAAELGLRVTGWSATGHDGIRHDPSRVISKIRNGVSPGGIILFHQSHLPSLTAGERACTLKKLVTTLKRDGYKFSNMREDFRA